MPVKYLIVFKNGDRKLVDRHFRLDDHVYCLTIHGGVSLDANNYWN